MAACGRESSGLRRLDPVKLARMKQKPQTVRNHPISEKRCFSVLRRPGIRDDNRQTDPQDATVEPTIGAINHQKLPGSYH